MLKKIIFPAAVCVCMMIAGPHGFNQTAAPEIKTREFQIEVHPFPGGNVIGEIILAGIPEIKNDLAGTYYYNVGFDVDALVVMERPGTGYYRNALYRIKKNTGGRFPQIEISNKEKRIIVISGKPPRTLFFRTEKYGQTKSYRVPLNSIAKNDAAAGLMKSYYGALMATIRINGAADDAPELRYRLQVLENRASGRENINLDSRWRRDRSDTIAGLLELTSGAQAIEGSLQLSVMRNISAPDNRNNNTIGVSTLPPPALKAHDFKKMLGREKIVASEIDRCAPHDAIYCRFGKIRHLFDCLDIAKLIQEELPVFTGFIDWKDDIQTKLLTQLGMKINPKLRKFYGLAVEEIALAIEDPYLIEGADLAFIFKLANRGLFEGQLKKYRGEFLESIPGATVRTVRHNTTGITALTSPDNRLSSYSFFDGDFAIIASSEWMAKRMADVRSGAVKSAADNPDFQYLMKTHRGPGDAFFYIGDDFVGRIISAPFKIAELRRVNCEANLKILRFARNLYLIENGGKEPVMKDLIEGGCLSRGPSCPEGGSYELAAGSAPRCSKHGPLGYLNRLSANEVTLISENEAGLYKNFVDNYHNYWRRFVDPIGIRIDLGDTISLKTVILPLIEHPDYRLIEDLFGGTPISLECLNVGNSAVIFHAAAKLKAFDDYKSDLSHIRDTRLKNEIQEEKKKFLEMNPGFKGDPLGWIGNEADFFMVDDTVALEEKSDFTRAFMNEQSLFNLAVFRVKVRDGALAERAIPAIMRHMVSMRTEIPSEKKYGGVLWRTNIKRIPLSLLLKDHSLWLAFQERHFETLARPASFTANLFKSGDEKLISLREETGIKERRANFEIGIHPRNIHKLRRQVNLMTNMHYMDYCTRNIEHLNLLVQLHEPMAWAQGDVSADVLTKYSTEFTVRCPMNGIYRCAGESADCSFHHREKDSDYNDELYRTMLDRGTKLAQVLYRLGNIVIDLGFTKEGLETQVHLGNPLKEH